MRTEKEILAVKEKADKAAGIGSIDSVSVFGAIVLSEVLAWVLGEPSNAIDRMESRIRSSRVN